MNPQHTPGPWMVTGGDEDRYAVYSPDCCVAVMGDDSVPANARLIAAADDVADCWESGDLAGAVTALQSVRGEAAEVLDKSGVAL